MTKIISRKEKEADTKKEPQTLFQHLGFGTKIKPDVFDSMKKYLKSMALFVIIGYLIGTILDIMLGTGYYSAIIAIGMLLFWIFKAFGKDLTPPKREKR